MTYTSHDTPTHLRQTPSAATSSLLGKVLLLVGAALAFSAAGAWLGRNLSPGTGLLLSFVALGLLIVQAVGGQRFRTGDLAVGWLLLIGAALGLGLGPTLNYYASTDPAAVTQAAVTTTIVVTLMGVTGFMLDKDLSRWMRPLTFVVFGLVAVSLVLFLLGSGGSPLVSLAIAAVSAALILVDLNYLRRHGTPDDAVLLATGIFVSIVNIFLSLLNVFGRE